MLVRLLFLLVWFLNQTRASESGNRIVGGKEAPEASIPWQVSMRNIDGTEYHFCGGSIIGKKWILTAAHCVQDRNLDSYEIVVGSNKLSSGGTRYKVESVIIHKDYNATLLTDDISLLKLEEEIEYADNIQPIEVDSGYVNGREKGIVSGWGYVDGDSGGPLVRNKKLVGLVSWNVPCGRGFPDVYTRLSSYANWIRKYTRD
ncbi:unnamed protein product [Colias eurytheme]|nr:unnamed protein product [Colias eurytheme]